MISVTAGLGFLIAAFDGCEDGARQDLHRSLSALRFTSAYERRRDYFDRVSAHVLRDGFEVLLCSPEKGKRYKIELILGSLDQLLDSEPAPAPFAPATVRLWAEIIGVVGETAMEQDGPAAQRQWMATAAAWAEGLQRIGRRALAEADRRAA